MKFSANQIKTIANYIVNSKVNKNYYSKPLGVSLECITYLQKEFSSLTGHQCWYSEVYPALCSLIVENQEAFSIFGISSPDGLIISYNGNMVIFP